MKKMVLGVMLFVMGALGSIACIVSYAIGFSMIVGSDKMSAYPTHEVFYGLFDSLMRIRFMLPFIVFCSIAAVGLVICIIEAFRKNKQA